MQYLKKKLKLFADDTNLFVAASSLAAANSSANNSINCLNSWFVANKLSLNIEKTCYMVFPPDTNKNSSGDEIANVNFLTTISHTRRPTSKYRKKTNLLRLTN